MISEQVRENLIAGLSVGGSDECWPWRGTHNNGYGVIWDKQARRNVYVHRAVLAIDGRDPGDLHTDHLCRNRDCGNPRHLEVVSLAENVMRGDGPTAENARKTHCKYGHEFSAENTYLRPDGSGRGCLTCRREERARRKS